VYRTESANYRVSPGAFFQVNRYLVDKLVGLVVGDRRGGTALDLYAGVGLFAVSLAQRFERVLAVESSPISFADLQYNVPANVKPLGVAVEQFVRNRAGSLRPDLVVVDPPRGGLGERLVRGIAELGPRRLTYVSCDPATLARDLAVLLGVGFRIAEAHLLDLFPQTFHVESVIHLGR
jgi:23S rRNA (uracil1939-C5)-methyltransferase